MLPLSYVLGAFGTLLEFILVWRIWQQRLWRPYPFFCSYVVYLLLNMLADTGLLASYGYRSRAYAIFYWWSDLIGVGLWALIAWGIFRHSFRRGSSLRVVVGAVSLALVVAITGLLVFLPSHGGPPRLVSYLTVNFERYACLVMAPLVLWLIAAARYYRIPLGRNVWGMAVGFGLFLSLGAINAAVYLLGGSSWILSSLSTPAAFVLQMLIWTWAFWRYAPNPDLAPLAREQGELELVFWRQEWYRLLDTMRKPFER